MQGGVSELIKAGRQTFSFELFPPKTQAGLVELWRTVESLEELHPDFVSVTYGAGGSTRARTIGITGRLARQTDLTVVGHLTCVGDTVPALGYVIDQYGAAGIRNLLALRGDPPDGPAAVWRPTPDGLDYAVQLVDLIKARGKFDVGVAAFPDPHPALMSAERDAEVLAMKQAAGAAFAITQFFFEVDAYVNLVERSRSAGVTLPIIPGLMPVTNVAQIERFAELSGATFPTHLAKRFHGVAESSDAVREMGIEIAIRMATELLSYGAPGLHLYTLNRSMAALDVFRNLGLPDRSSRLPARPAHP